MKKILTIFGTRPEIIKLSPVIPLIDKYFKQILVHTGQHYSYNMDKLFFEEIKLRDPDFNLSVGSGSHGYQTGTIMMKIEPIIEREHPDLLLVQGDTNSTLAGALIAAKSGIPLAHIESGYRSGDISQPEEINRIIADRLAHFAFAGNDDCEKNLIREGIPKNRIYNVGNTAIEALRRNEKFASKDILEKMGVSNSKYVLVTFHRAGNTDNEANLVNICRALNSIAEKITIIFPIHPRTKKALKTKDVHLDEKIKIVEPLGYLEFITLMKCARFIMTDSGGIQEEAVELNIPCLILRNETEATDLVKAGKNVLATTETINIVSRAERLIKDDSEVERIKKIKIDAKKGVSERIVRILHEKM